MMKSTLRFVLLAVIAILAVPTILAVPLNPADTTPASGSISFGGAENPAVLNPALIWDAGDSLYNRYSVTDYPGKLLLVAAPDTFIGPSVCTPASGDFSSEVHVKIAPQSNRQGAGIFVRAVGTYDVYIGAARYYRSEMHSIGSWGMYDAATPLAPVYDPYIAADVDLHIDRTDGLLNLAFKGGTRREWTPLRMDFEFPLPDKVEVCLNTWSVDTRLISSAVFDNFTLTD